MTHKPEHHKIEDATGFLAQVLCNNVSKRFEADIEGTSVVLEFHGDRIGIFADERWYGVSQHALADMLYRHIFYGDIP